MSVAPDPPQTAMLHLIVRRPLEGLTDALFEVAEARSLWPGAGFSATEDPTAQRCELTATVANLDVPLDEVVDLWREILDRAASDQPIVGV